MEQLAENQITTEPKTESIPADLSRRFNLKYGYPDKENPEIIHRAVEINRRPTGADFFKAVEGGTDDKAANVRINLSLIASSISKFGGIRMPMPESVLLSLNEIDENRLNEEYLLFLVGTQPDTEQKVLKDKRVQLAFGIERDGVKYHIIEFGKLLNGYDRIKILDETNSEWQFQALKIAREVVKISTLDESQSVPGELTLAEIETMDVSDFLVIREAEGAWLNSFRD